MICHPTDLRLLNDVLDNYCSKNGIAKASRHRSAAAEILANAYGGGVKERGGLEISLHAYATELDRRLQSRNDR